MILLFPAWVRAEVAVSPLTKRVTDLTGSLAAGRLKSLEAGLTAFEQINSSQIAVLLALTTQSEIAEALSIRVADGLEAWAQGGQGVNGGLLPRKSGGTAPFLKVDR